jgi:hypothetical protein
MTEQTANMKQTSPIVSLFLATALLVFSGISLSSSCSKSFIDGSLASTTQQTIESSSDSMQTFSQMSQLILEKYDPAVGDNSTSSHEKLYNAILGMELAENDGKPVPIHGHPYLFVGSAGTQTQGEYYCYVLQYFSAEQYVLQFRRDGAIPIAILL